METPQYLSDFKCVLYFQNKLSAVIFLFHSKLLKSLINQMNLDQFGGKILFFSVCFVKRKFAGEAILCDPGEWSFLVS